MKCLICNNQNEFLFSSKILEKYTVGYFYCGNCGFLQTEPPYWLSEAYSESINRQDTGYLARNIGISNKVSNFLLLAFGPSGEFLDYAGGYGVFVRLMRDKGFNFYWQDKYTENIFAKGFDQSNIQRKFDAVTSFESLEHFPNPMEELENIFSLTSTLIFTTELLSREIPAPEHWRYYGLEHGQHISFYSQATLQYIANFFQARVFGVGSIYVITKNSRVQFWQLMTSAALGKLGIHNLSTCFLKSKTLEDSLNFKNR